MAFASRILAAMQSELSKQISFQFHIARHHTRLGSHSLEAGDRCRIEVRVWNHSGLPLKRVRGAIEPTPWVEFASRQFNLPVLRPGQQDFVAALELRVLHNPAGEDLLDRIGTVSFSVQVDLSEISLSEFDKPLTPTRQVCRESPMVRASCGVGFDRRAIPLSPVFSAPRRTAQLAEQ